MMEIVMSIKLYKWFASYRGIEYYQFIQVNKNTGKWTNHTITYN